MLVCHCNGISDRAIRQAVRNGAQTPGEVARDCGAGNGCGGCLRTVSRLIRNESAHRTESPQATPSNSTANA